MDNLTTNTQKLQMMQHQANAQQLIKQEAHLASIELLTDQEIEYKGHNISLAPAAFKDLLKTIGMDKKVVGVFSSAVGDAKTKQLLDLVKRNVSASGKTVQLYLNPTSKEIERISDKNNKSEGLARPTYFNLIDRLINSNPNFEIKNYSVSTQELNINLIDKKAEFELLGQKNENFYPGISLNTKFGRETHLSTFTERLICTNGAVTHDEFAGYTLTNNFTKEQWSRFFEHFKQLQQVGWISEIFKTKALEAIKTRASVGEMETARKAMTFNCKTLGNDVNLWIPWDQTAERFATVGIDLNFMSEARKARANTGTTIWQLFNGMTDFASHKFNFEISEQNRSRLQEAAGRLLMKREYDMSMDVVSPFK